MNEAKRRLALRNAGYADGLAGRRAASPEAEYQQSHRRGREKRAELQSLPPKESK